VQARCGEPVDRPAKHQYPPLLPLLELVPDEVDPAPSVWHPASETASTANTIETIRTSFIRFLQGTERA
jgi:hypothetical protein